MVNRFANYSPSVDVEIESSILRGLVPPGRAGETKESTPEPAVRPLAL